MTRPAFDYSELPEQQARWLKDQAKQISTQLRHNAASVLNIGKRLIEVKSRLSLPAFYVWIRAEFEWSVTTAKRYIACAKRFGDLDCAWVIQTSAMISMVKPSVPESAINEIIALARSKRSISGMMAIEIITRHQASRLSEEPTATRSSVPAQRSRSLDRKRDSVWHAVNSFQRNLPQLAAATMSADERQALAATLERLAAEVLTSSEESRETRNLGLKKGERIHV